MKANQLATLVLRLLGIYCLIVFVPTVSFFSVFFYAQNGAFVSILAGLFLILWLAVGISLIVRSVSWGEKLTPKDAGDEKITVTSFEQIQILAFAVAGVLIFAGELPQLFNSIFSLFGSAGIEVIDTEQKFQDDAKRDEKREEGAGEEGEWWGSEGEW